MIPTSDQAWQRIREASRANLAANAWVADLGDLRLADDERPARDPAPEAVAQEPPETD